MATATVADATEFLAPAGDGPSVLMVFGDRVGSA